jgi:hypothetical protein
MFVDEGGALWLSNPWLALTAIVGLVAIVVWCHRWLESGKAPMPRRLSRSAPQLVLRPHAQGQKLASRTTASSAVRFRAGTGPASRRRMANRLPRHAA